MSTKGLPAGRRGFGLIEFIIYIALVSVVVTSIVTFGWNVVYGREKAYTNQVVQSEARLALARIEHEIRNAKDIVSVSPNTLVLDNGTDQTTISLSGGQIQITIGTNGPYSLTSNQLVIANLEFVDLSTTDADSVGVSLTGQSQDAISTVYSSSSLLAQFNQSQSLLVDPENATLLSANTDMSGITFQNTGDQAITIDQINIAWTGTAGGENVTQIQIGAGQLEWSGSANSGDYLDIEDFTLSPSDGVVSIDSINFDSDMQAANFEITFVLLDQSTSRLSLQFAITPTPPPTTCAQYCILLGYTSGTCRQNSSRCGQFSEIYEEGGNILCTGGPNADTCCCQP